MPPTIPEKSTWDDRPTPVSTASRFGGKGWGALDDDDGGLFGKGGASVKSDPWGSETNNGNENENGWDDSSATTPIAGPSQVS